MPSWLDLSFCPYTSKPYRGVIPSSYLYSTFFRKVVFFTIKITTKSITGGGGFFGGYDGCGSGR